MAWAQWSWSSVEAYSAVEEAEAVPQARSAGLNEAALVTGHLAPDLTPRFLVTPDCYCSRVQGYSVDVRAQDAVWAMVEP